MAIELNEFHEEIFQDILGSSDAEGKYQEDSFFETFCSYLIDAGEMETADRSFYVGARGLRVDGYGGDPINADNVLTLIVSDFNKTPGINSLTGTEMEAIFKRVNNFLEKSLNVEFKNSLEETSCAFGLVDLISTRWNSIEKVRFFLISNRKLSARVDGMAAGEFKGCPLTYNVWDIERLHRFATSGQGREEIIIDLSEDFGGALMVLPASHGDNGCETYLAVIPGKQLASIYDRWGVRLLEQNVRVFLQARGNVNKGIKNTLENEPEMFFAYNNGITSTATSIDIEEREGKKFIRELKNFQIVNGGQTTASIHAASRKKDADLSNVFVQMKLSIVAPEKAIDLVPNISRYANTQNRINAADFFANHPFHVRMEGFSRRIFAPSTDGSFRQSKWFYERARGQYNDARAYLSTGEKRKFELEFPKKQVFSKTDMAKFLNLWNERPYIVSKGAQKNFVDFARLIGRKWSENELLFNETYYRHLIAKAIVFKEVEKLVSAQPWYSGGYRANIVAYTISKMSYDVRKMGKYVNFEDIWKRQDILEEMKKMLAIVSEKVNSAILETPPGRRNVSEWAKETKCWDKVRNLKIDWPIFFTETLLSAEEQGEVEEDGKKEQKILDGIEAQTLVVEAGSDFWSQVKNWAADRGSLSTKESGVLDVALAIPSKIPTDKQSQTLIVMLKRLHEEGCPLGKEIA